MSQHYSNKFYDAVKKHVSKLNYEWFERKQINFKREKLFDTAKGKIYTVITTQIPTYKVVNEYGSSILNFQNIDTIVEIDFVQYCKCYLPISQDTEWGNLPFKSLYSSLYPPDNIVEIAECLMNAIQPFTEGLNALEISRFTSRIMDLVNDELELLNIDGTRDNSYLIILEEFLRVFQTKFFKKNENRLTSYEVLSIDKDDKLDFNLSQEELVSLLYILADSNILKGDSVYDKGRFIRFCFKYFTIIKKGRSVSLVNFKRFDEAYRKKITEEGGQGLIKIKERLSRTLANIPDIHRKK